jgi:hypothetical protein
MLCCFVGAVFGTLRYVYIQAAERSVHYLAWVLCFWSLGVATAVVICRNCQCMHSRLPQSGNLHWGPAAAASVLICVQYMDIHDNMCCCFVCDLHVNNACANMCTVHGHP